MLKKYGFIGLLIGALVLSGCEAQVFGVPKSQFQKMTPAQRQVQIAKYNHDQAEQAKLQPYLDALGAPASTHPMNKTINSHHHTTPMSCHMEGNTQVCSGSSSGSSTSIGID